jgi:hypothetical protein
MKKHKEKKVSRILLFILTLTGMVFSVYLVFNEIYGPGFCPEIFNIPACYLVITSFILVFISLFLKKAPVGLIIFYLGALSGLGIAIWFSSGQILRVRDCPDLFNIPLCFGSALLFILIIIFGNIGTRK